jgi:hypothetical protein
MSTNPDVSEFRKMGKDFEAYLRCHIFVKKYYVSMEMSEEDQSNGTNKIDSSDLPDFKFRDKRHQQPFFLEAKFREKESEEKINWCTTAQLKRYQELENLFPLFILIGFGGKPDNPQKLFLFPLSEASGTELPMQAALKFEIPLCKAIIPEDLWKMTKPEYKKAG